MNLIIPDTKFCLNKGGGDVPKSIIMVEDKQGRRRKEEIIFVDCLVPEAKERTND